MVLPANEGILCLLLILALAVFGINSSDVFSQDKGPGIGSPDIYRPGATLLNLLGSEYDWEPVNQADIHRSDSEMNLTVDTSRDDEVYHRASMRTNVRDIPTYLSVTYSSESSEGNAIYGISIRDLQNSKIFWGRLNNTGGQILNQTISIPNNAFFGNFDREPQVQEFRLTIITDQPGIHYLNFSSLQLAVSPDYTSLAAAMPWLFLPDRHN